VFRAFQSLYRLRRGLRRAMASHHDDLDIWAAMVDLLQDVERVNALNKDVVGTGSEVI
jgi:hypothetical protein